MYGWQTLPVFFVSCINISIFIHENLNNLVMLIGCGKVEWGTSILWLGERENIKQATVYAIIFVILD